ncbi:MAG: DUF2318 domain-containing protein [Planctomycetota bacterium]|nr:MAG: DUF2318 domain-containing protein [Planctomycetota bacterium]
MFEAFVITLREGIEAALVIGILIVALRAFQRRDLEKTVWVSVLLAVIASVLMAFWIFHFIQGYEEAYEGIILWTAAFFVLTMMVWMHRKGKVLQSQIQQKVENIQSQGKSKWGEILAIGFFTFFMVLREGAETVLFLSAVQLSTESILSFIGGILGILLSILFCFFFIRGTLVFNLKRFFFVTEVILAIFLVQLIINGYHEFAEAGWMPATKTSMALIGPIVRHNTLFLISVLVLPLVIWISNPPLQEEIQESWSEAEKRLALSKIRKKRFYRFCSFITLFSLIFLLGFVYAQEISPKTRPVPLALEVKNGLISIPKDKLEDGKLHHFGVLTSHALVRILGMKTKDGKHHICLDACEICGPMGYIQEGEALVCLNCSGEINPLSLGLHGGCNPIPLSFKERKNSLEIDMDLVKKEAPRFKESAQEIMICPVCEMKFPISKASSFVTYKGKNYFFCNMGGCKEKFMKTPEKFAK